MYETFPLQTGIVMGRRKKKKQVIKQIKIIRVEYQSRDKKQLLWNLLGLILAIITGIAMPLYFQHQTDLSQTTILQKPLCDPARFSM